MSDARQRRRYLAIQDSIRHAWRGYQTRVLRNHMYILDDDIDPVAGTGTSWLHHAATLHDSLDTLYLAGLLDEYNEAVQYVTTWDVQSTAMKPTKTFEYSIRVVGGLLGAYSVSGDARLLQTAVRATDALLAGPFASSPTVLPRMYDVLAPVSQQSIFAVFYQGFAFLYRWGRDKFTEEHRYNSLAGLGSFAVEFYYLSEVTGEYRYRSAANNIYYHVMSKKDSSGMVPRTWNVMEGSAWNNDVAGFASGGDSFYEYLPKVPLLVANATARHDETLAEMFSHYKSIARNGMRKHVFSVGGILYPHDSSIYDHLHCFLPGMLALVPTDLPLAEKLWNACYSTYTGTSTKLGPEQLRISSRGTSMRDARFQLRPEFLESTFYLYRRTKNETYREVAWDVFEAIEEQCRVTFGYSGLIDVNVPASHDRAMPSFFLAETLKYLLLMYAPEEYVSLDDFIFTTEAHPLRRTTDEYLCPVERRFVQRLPTPWLTLLAMSLLLVVLVGPLLCLCYGMNRKVRSRFASKRK